MPVEYLKINKATIPLAVRLTIYLTDTMLLVKMDKAEQKKGKQVEKVKKREPMRQTTNRSLQNSNQKGVTIAVASPLLDGKEAHSCHLFVCGS